MEGGAPATAKAEDGWQFFFHMNRASIISYMFGYYFKKEKNWGSKCTELETHVLNQSKNP